MPKTKDLPVYDIEDFESRRKEPEFYANLLSVHVARHKFTNLPHKHDFYFIMLVSRGDGWHELDFTRYKIKPGSVFFMQPGQMHYWKLSADIEGYVLFHSQAFYDEGYTFTGVRHFPFYRSGQTTPLISVNSLSMEKLEVWFREIINEKEKAGAFQVEKIHALINLIYIELARNYEKKVPSGKASYLSRLHEFEALIEKNFREIKAAGDYAAMVNISPKHLNRIVKETLGKTSTDVIADRTMLEAKRLLIPGKLTVTEIGYELGFSDKSYFVRFFKKHAGETPMAFLKRVQKNSA
jgi:AraC-like DNA-binding protein/quercetin dioxygenase-like cupin family protein